jgi:DNA modification methylase
LIGDWPVKTVTYSSVIHTPQGQAATVTATGHPHTKPVSLMEFLVRLTAAETVLDPFMGSGSTGVACANSGRKFIGIELDPTYFQIACERIAAAYAQGRLFA